MPDGSRSRWLPSSSAGWIALPALVAAVLVAVLLFARSAERPAGSGDFGRAPGAAGTSPASAPASPAAPSEPTSAGSAREGEGPDGEGPDRPAPDAGPSGAAGDLVPVRVDLPRLGVRAALRPVGVDADDRVEIPSRSTEAGWYRFGPAPGGAEGSAVLVGHVDVETGELGAFAALYDLRAGDEVKVVSEGAQGSTETTETTETTYRVTGRRTVPKQELPDAVFRRKGPPVLTMITCAAPFDRSRGGYQSNLVVTAEPVRSGG
ncbi:class F sortase [Streptomyces indicus]|uniref:Sortase family protein n=1 Tax=Streptomyces indicus TaxID=417292 RepID=A0A1G8TVF1_9ACTN|nr:class F sortase [Streptomyces indicus]SDJ44895.1 Sortase family protein [Streptomyces indicus]